MSPDTVDKALDQARFPRVSGDEPSYRRRCPEDHEFSPRERG